MLDDRLRVRVWIENKHSYYQGEGEYHYDVQNMVIFHDGKAITVLDAIDKGIITDALTEQCTGFKDCNKDLMFVGDIIKVCIETDDTAFGYDVIGNFVIIEENGQLLAVNVKCYSKYINCEGIFYENDVCDLGWICDNDPEIEIVGNIHKNPELLKQ